MNYKEYLIEKEKLLQKQNTIRNELITLDKLFIESLPFKVGDKVDIPRHGVGWIESISTSYIDKLDIYFYPPKKDGTRSNRRRCAYFISHDSIKKL